jgi:hypothetical protein
MTRALGEVFDAHTGAEFKTRDIDATMATMSEMPDVTHVPMMTGGHGREQCVVSTTLGSLGTGRKIHVYVGSHVPAAKSIPVRVQSVVDLPAWHHCAACTHNEATHFKYDVGVYYVSQSANDLQDNAVTNPLQLDLSTERRYGSLADIGERVRDVRFTPRRDMLGVKCQ